MAKILIVDDDKLIREGVIEMLKSSGGDYEIVSAVDGTEGLATALKEKPDVIVSDVQMPKMTGTDMAEELRKDEWGSKVPIIIMTNDESADTINRALASGVSAYLSKATIDETTLIQQIKLALGS